MATRDGRTFGKAEFERLYDFMADHKDASFELCVNHARLVLDMTQDEAEAAVAAMRKERRKAYQEPSGQRPFLDCLGDQEKVILEVLREGEAARDSGKASPYRGNTLAHCLHGTGWVHRDLQLALEKATGGKYTARKLTFDGRAPVPDTLHEISPAMTAAERPRREAGKVMYDDDAAKMLGDQLKSETEKAEELAMHAERFNKTMQELARLSEIFGRPVEFRAKKTGEFTPEEIMRDVVSRDYEIVTPVMFQGFDLGSEVENWDDLLDKELVTKIKGYPFPGVILTEFTTRRGKRRVVVEGIGDGNDQCLHIFSRDDLCDLEVTHGWVFRYADEWQHSFEYPDNADAFTCRPATEAECSLASSRD